MQEILSVEGWESATRYTVEGVVGAGRSDRRYRFLSLYELSCPPAEAVANLEAANMGSADSYVEKKDADEGKLPLPDWFTAIQFGSWNCTQVSERITLTRPHPHHPRRSTMTNNLYLVFSEKPDHISVEDYHRWYAAHAQENIESPEFVSAQRYTIQEIANSEPVGDKQHLALVRIRRRHVDVANRPDETNQGRRRRAAGLVQGDQVQELELRAAGRAADPAVALTIAIE